LIVLHTWKGICGRTKKPVWDGPGEVNTGITEENHHLELGYSMKPGLEQGNLLW